MIKNGFGDRNKFLLLPGLWWFRDLRWSFRGGFVRRVRRCAVTVGKWFPGVLDAIHLFERVLDFTCYDSAFYLTDAASRLLRLLNNIRLWGPVSAADTA
jgi:hypothetical protein